MQDEIYKFIHSDQMGNIIPPCSGSTMESLPTWMCPEDQERCSGKTLISQTGQTTAAGSFQYEGEEFQLLTLSLKDEPSKPQEETNFSK